MMATQLRIRAIEKEDFPETRKMICYGMYEQCLPNLKTYFGRNKLSHFLMATTILAIVIFLEKNIWESIASLLLLEVSLVLAGVAQFYWEIGVELDDIKKSSMTENYIKFWIAELIIDGRWTIVGSVALVKPRIYNSRSRYAVALKRLSVKTNFRGKKIGEKLLQHAIHQAIEMGHGTVQLSCANTQKEALKLYKKHGFEVININTLTYLAVLGRGVDILHMEKQLDTETE